MGDKNHAFTSNTKASHTKEVLLDHCEKDITPESKINLFCDACHVDSLETVELLLNRCKNEMTPEKIGLGLFYAGQSSSSVISKFLLDNYQDMISTDDKFQTLRAAILPQRRDDQLSLVIRLLNDEKVTPKITHTPDILRYLLDYFNRLDMKKELNTCIECFTKHDRIRLYLLENPEAFPNLTEAANAAQINCSRRIKSSAKVYRPSTPQDKQSKIEPSETKQEQSESEIKPKKRKRLRLHLPRLRKR